MFFSFLFAFFVKISLSYLLLLFILCIIIIFFVLFFTCIIIFLSAHISLLFQTFTFLSLSLHSLSLSPHPLIPLSLIFAFLLVIFLVPRLPYYPLNFSDIIPHSSINSIILFFSLQYILSCRSVFIT